MQKQHKIYSSLILSLTLVALTAFPMCGIHITRTAYLESDPHIRDIDEDGYELLSDFGDLDSMQVAQDPSMLRLQEIMQIERQKIPAANRVQQEENVPEPVRVSNALVEAQHVNLADLRTESPRTVAVRKQPAMSKKHFKRPPVLQFAPLFDKAVDLYYKQHYVEAIEQFRALLEFNAAHPLANQCQYWIGEAYFAMGAYYAAVVEYEKVALFPHSPKSSDARLMIGIALFRVGENSLAERELEGLLADNEKQSVQITAQRYLRKISQA